MTNLITLTIPNDDIVALHQFGKALIEIASAKEGHPVDVTVTPLVISAEKLQQSATNMMDELRFEGEELQGKRKEPEVDTTVQQVESLATHVITSQEKDGDPVDLGDGNLSQGYRIEMQELPTTDSTGTPWDERIHSASKALNADGTWRLRRKPKDMDEAEWAALIESVKLELVHGEEIREAMDKAERGDAVYYISEEAEQKMEEFKESVHQSVEPPVTPPGDDFHTDAGVVTEQTVAGIPPLPVPPPVVVASPVPEVAEWDFPRLMTFLTERHGKIDVATVNTLLAQDGMLSVQELNAHPDKIGPFVARVKAHLGE